MLPTSNPDDWSFVLSAKESFGRLLPWTAFKSPPSPTEMLTSRPLPEDRFPLLEVGSSGELLVRTSSLPCSGAFWPLCFKGWVVRTFWSCRLVGSVTRINSGGQALL